MGRMERRLRRAGLVISLCAALGAAVSCGGATSGSQTGPVARSELPGALAHAICSNVGPCCTGASLPFDEGKCETVLSQVYKTSLPDGDGGAYDPAAAGPCLDAIAATARQCSFESTSATQAASCDAVYSSNQTKHGKAGDPCDATCTTGTGSISCSSFTSSGFSSDGGTSPSTVVSGSCFTNDGLYCDGAAQKCRAQASVGAECSSSEECRDSWCDGSHCVPYVAEGGSCATSSRACGPQLGCDFSQSVCVARKADGAACTTGDECQAGICHSQRCGSGSDANKAFLKLACAG